MKGLKMLFVLILGMTMGLAHATLIPSTSFEFGQDAWNDTNGILKLGVGVNALAISTPESSVMPYISDVGSRFLKINSSASANGSVLFSNGPFVAEAGKTLSFFGTFVPRNATGSNAGSLAIILGDSAYSIFGQTLQKHLFNLDFSSDANFSALGFQCSGLSSCLIDDMQYGAHRNLPSGAASNITVLSQTFGTAPPPATAVPEPGSMALLLAGIIGLGATARKRVAVCP